jgi:hypothetical protein
LQRRPGGIDNEAAKPDNDKQSLYPPVVFAQGAKLIEGKSFVCHESIFLWL